MSFEVRYTPIFKKALKRLAKKYPSLTDDFADLLDRIERDPKSGTPIGKNCYKVRMAIS